MSAETKSTMEKIVLGIAIATFAYTVAKAIILIPSDVKQLQVEVSKVTEGRTIDHDLLQRIDERTAQTQRDISELKGRKSNP